MNLLAKYFHLPKQEKLMLLRAFEISLIAKALVTFFPIRWYKKFLETNTNQSPSLEADEKIRLVTMAVNRCSRFAPWKTKCLVDAITAKLLLRKYRIGATLFLGVSKQGVTKLQAHAWLKVGEKFITGKRGHQNFTVVSSFT